MAGLFEDIIRTQQRRSHGEYALDGIAPDTVAELEEALNSAERDDMARALTEGVFKVGDKRLSQRSTKKSALRDLAAYSIGSPTLGSKLEGVSGGRASVELHEAAGRIGNVFKDGKDYYVDTAFVQLAGNNAASVLPGSELKHLGLGEFSLVGGREGDIEFDRMRGRDFPGQIGRSHKLFGNQSAIKVLVKNMVKRGHAKVAEKFKPPTPGAVAMRTGMKVREKPRGRAQKAIYDYFMDVYGDGQYRPWITIDDLSKNARLAGRHTKHIMSALDAMVKSGLLDRLRATSLSLGGNRYRLAEWAPARSIDGSDPEGVELPAADLAILDALSEADGGTLSAPDIAEATGVSKSEVRSMLASMARENIVARVSPAGDVWRVTHFGEACKFSSNKKRRKKNRRIQEERKYTVADVEKQLVDFHGFSPADVRKYKSDIQREFGKAVEGGHRDPHIWAGQRVVYGPARKLWRSVEERMDAINDAIDNKKFSKALKLAHSFPKTKFKDDIVKEIQKAKEEKGGRGGRLREDRVQEAEMIGFTDEEKSLIRKMKPGQWKTIERFWAKEYKKTGEKVAKAHHDFILGLLSKAGVTEETLLEYGPKDAFAAAAAGFGTIAKNANKGSQLAKKGDAKNAVYQLDEIVDVMLDVLASLQLAAGVTVSEWDDIKAIKSLQNAQMEIMDLYRHLR